MANALISVTFFMTLFQCLGAQLKTLLKLSVFVPMMQTIVRFIEDILVPSIQNISLRKEKKIDIKVQPFLIRLMIALLWSGFLCIFFKYFEGFK
jgi:hypothetical protein